MGQFARHHGLRDDPDDLSATRQHRIGDHAHEPDMPAAIHQAIAVADEKLAQGCGCLPVEAIGTNSRTEDADTLHATSSVRALSHRHMGETTPASVPQPPDPPICIGHDDFIETRGFSAATRSLRAASVVRERAKKSARVCAKGTRMAVGEDAGP